MKYLSLLFLLLTFACSPSVKLSTPNDVSFSVGVDGTMFPGVRGLVVRAADAFPMSVLARMPEENGEGVTLQIGGRRVLLFRMPAGPFAAEWRIPGSPVWLPQPPGPQGTNPMLFDQDEVLAVIPSDAMAFLFGNNVQYLVLRGFGWDSFPEQGYEGGLGMVSVDFDGSISVFNPAGYSYRVRNVGGG